MAEKRLGDFQVELVDAIPPKKKTAAEVAREAIDQLLASDKPVVAIKKTSSMSINNLRVGACSYIKSNDLALNVTQRSDTLYVYKKYAANAVHLREEFLKSNVFLQANDTKASTLKKHTWRNT